ncbi:MAG: hypothetical protein MCS20_01870, partial [Candidatus Phytoplasma mali]|nr:hypothetical protein [Candidatus Phytoplasma mali]
NNVKIIFLIVKIYYLNKMYAIFIIISSKDCYFYYFSNIYIYIYIYIFFFFCMQYTFIHIYIIFQI